MRFEPKAEGEGYRVYDRLFGQWVSPVVSEPDALHRASELNALYAAAETRRSAERAATASSIPPPCTPTPVPAPPLGHTRGPRRGTRDSWLPRPPTQKNGR